MKRGRAEIERRGAFRDDSCRRQEAQLVPRGIGQLLMEGLGMSIHGREKRTGLAWSSDLLREAEADEEDLHGRGTGSFLSSRDGHSLPYSPLPQTGLSIPSSDLSSSGNEKTTFEKSNHRYQPIRSTSILVKLMYQE